MTGATPTSASGLDPDISPTAAQLQVSRVAADQHGNLPLNLCQSVSSLAIWLRST
ncbi:MAG: potassium-transporting ATPase subunit C [Terracidiphilus sp.]